MKIMIVDDNKSIRSLVRRVIGFVTREKIELRECSDGNEAVTSYSESPSDLVVMDIAMPQKDGIAAAEEITANDISAKIIFLTQHSVSDYGFLKEKPGVLAVISKENVAELKAELELHLPK
ncbi:MAG: response regulator transcription factor [Bacteroidota bacterium]